jgi:hypothetical protein
VRDRRRLSRSKTSTCFGFFHGKTKVRLKHSATPKPDPIPTPTPRTPLSAYARCDECGTDAGEPCYDSHDRPCAPCSSRVLASSSADRRDSLQRWYAKPAPTPTTCTACGIVVRRGGKYCTAVVCQRAARKARPPAKSVACKHCGTAIRTDGNYCSARECMAAKKAGYRSTTPAPTPASWGEDRACWWCGVALPTSGELHVGRGAGCDRPCCGDHACKRAIKRDRVERERATPPANSPA